MGLGYGALIIFNFDLALIKYMVSRFNLTRRGLNKPVTPKFIVIATSGKPRASQVLLFKP